jgi:hypothetical protein
MKCFILFTASVFFTVVYQATALAHNYHRPGYKYPQSAIGHPLLQGGKEVSVIIDSID